jgi:hypothetical protein
MYSTTVASRSARMSRHDKMLAARRCTPWLTVKQSFVDDEIDAIPEGRYQNERVVTKIEEWHKGIRPLEGLFLAFKSPSRNHVCMLALDNCTFVWLHRKNEVANVRPWIFALSTLRVHQSYLEVLRSSTNKTCNVYGILL